VRRRYPAWVSRVGGKYRIIAHLRGGDATEASLVSVESASSGEQGLAVMKHLKLGDDADAQALERFEEEGRLCKRLDHPNLPKLLEAGHDDGGPVLVFEYVEGPSLARLRSRAVKRGGGIPVPLALRIVRQIAKALSYAHELTDESGKPLKLVHRDVSPENVTVTYDGDVKLSDFGMATTAASSAKSRENRVKGNVAYMAPEQARAEFALDARADIFALGVIFWEMLTGKRLWDGLSEVDVLKRLGEDSPLPSAKSVVPELPDEVDALCTQALAKVRDERFDAATDFLEVTQKLIGNPELKASAEDLGAFVTSLFEDERTKMRAVVEESRAADSEKALPAIGALPAKDASPFVDAESDPNLRIGVATPEETPDKRVVEVIRVEPSSDRRFAYLMGAVVALVLGIVAVVAMTGPKEQEKKIESKPYVAPTRPVPTAEPSASAYVEPEEVTIDIRVTPAEAKLFVDGVKANNPHHLRVVPAKFQHAIRAEMDGFETRNMSVAFDKERSIEIALVPGKPGKRPGDPKPAPTPSTN
jgi:eukaryotic-like serine/threonine-protein kinase